MAARVGSRGAVRHVTSFAGHGFAASTEELENGMPAVSVVGEVDQATVRAFEQALLEVVEDRAGAVVVDLSACSFLDSRGLSALFAARARLERAQRRMILVLSNRSVLRIFEITHADVHFEIHPTLRAAVEATASSD